MSHAFLFETDEHAAIREQARRFAEREIRPHAHAWEEAGAFPLELYRCAAEAGLLGLGYPEALGGTGGDFTHAHKTGWWASDTAELFFEDLRVPVANRIGDEGAGFVYTMMNFTGERLYRDARLYPIGGGTREIMNEVISKAELGRP